MTALLILTFILLITPSILSAQSDVPECENGFRLIEHALGESCVPENPERIVPLDLTVFELLLISGQTPAAFSSTVLNSYLRMQPALEEQIADLMETAQDFGYPPNIEAILEAHPDLIIGPRDYFTESLYPELNEIAATVLYDPAPGDWRSRLIFAGDVLGLTETVDELLADYDARMNELIEMLGENPETTVSLVRTFPGQIGLLLEGTAGAALLAEVGLPRPESQTLDYEYVLNELDGRPELLISTEELPLADGDVIFVFGDAPQLMENPLWQTLEGARNDMAFDVGYYWWGDSLLSAHAMLDDLFEYVAGVEPEHANPFAEGIPAPE